MQIGSTQSLTGVVTIETSMQSVSGTDCLLMVVHQILVDDTRLVVDGTRFVVGGTKLVDDTKPGGVPILSQVLLLRRPMVDSGAEHTSTKTLKTLAHLAWCLSVPLSPTTAASHTHTAPGAGRTNLLQAVLLVTCVPRIICAPGYMVLVAKGKSQVKSNVILIIYAPLYCALGLSFNTEWPFQ